MNSVEFEQYVKENATNSIPEKNLYQLKLNKYVYAIRLLYGEDGDILSTFMYKRQVEYDSGKGWEFLWSFGHVETFSILSTELEVVVLSKRNHGEPKLDKPKELKGIKPADSIAFNKHCKFPVFQKDNALYIQCKDYLSPYFVPPVEDAGKPLSYILKKYFATSKSIKTFVYPDTWGSVVLRSEAWIKVSNIQALQKFTKRIEKKQHIWKAFYSAFLKDGKILREENTDWMQWIEKFSEKFLFGT